MSSDKPKREIRRKEASVNVDGLQDDLKAFYFELEDGLKETYPDGGYELIVTSGKRNKKIGTAGDKSHHLTGNAFDLQADKKVYDYLYNTPKGVGTLVKYNLGLLDETSEEMLKKTGGSGVHLHVGRDSKYVAQTQQRFKSFEQDFTYVPMGSSGEHHDHDGHDHGQEEPKISAPTVTTTYVPTELQEMYGSFLNDVEKTKIKEKKVEESSDRQKIEQAIEEKNKNQREFLQSVIGGINYDEPNVQSPTAQRQRQGRRNTFQPIDVQTELPELPSIFKFENGGETGDEKQKDKREGVKGDAIIPYRQPSVEVTNGLSRSYYDPISETIYLTEEDSKDKEIVAHEVYHHIQNMFGRMNVETYPIKRATIPYSDEEASDYFNRKSYEVYGMLHQLREENPDLRFVPDQLIYDKTIDDMQYSDPTTMEGEAWEVQKIISENPSFIEDMKKHFNLNFQQ